METFEPTFLYICRLGATISLFDEMSEQEMVTRSSAAATARPPDAFKELLPLMKDPSVVCLLGGAPLPSLFPIANITVTLADGTSIELDGAATHSAQRYAPFAQDDLLCFCRNQVRTLHAPPGDWEVELTAGSMAAIDACFDNVLDPGCTVLVEQFTFTAALDALRSSRAHLATVRCDAEGLVPEALEARCAELRARNVRPRALFTIPKGQNPTGSVLRRERYEAVYAIACKYDFLIIEDDPYFYLQFCKEGQSEAEGLPGLQLGTSYLSCDTQGRVLRLDSFSKLMAPGFRLGWITGAPQLLRHYRQHAYAASQWGSSLAMKVLAGILQGWGDARFEEVVLTTQAAYKQRRDVVLAAAASHLADVATWDVPAAGFFLWVRATGHVPVEAAALRAAMEKHGVVVLVGEAASADNASAAGRQYFRISFNLDDMALLAEGVRRLGAMLRAFRRD